MDGNEFFLDGAEWAAEEPAVAATAVAAKTSPAAALQKRSEPLKRAAKSEQQPLYFDLETVGDHARSHLFGLDPVPPVPAEDDIATMPDPEKVVAGTVDDVKKTLAKIACAPWAWLDLVAAAENVREKDKGRGPKPTPNGRSGVHEAIALARRTREEAIQAHEDRRKLLSVTPEFCSIAALGIAVGNAPPISLVVGEMLDDAKDDTAPDIVTERYILETFWAWAEQCSPLIGFNCLHFDLPVIFVRSAILGVASTRMIDLKPWGGQVLDIYAARFPKSDGGKDGRPRKLKALAKVLGIEVPAGDVDGSQVEELMKSDPAKVGEYVRSDISITRAMHQSLSGFFWQ